MLKRLFFCFALKFVVEEQLNVKILYFKKFYCLLIRKLKLKILNQLTSKLFTLELIQNLKSKKKF